MCLWFSLYFLLFIWVLFGVFLLFYFVFVLKCLQHCLLLCSCRQFWSLVKDLAICEHRGIFSSLDVRTDHICTHPKCQRVTLSSDALSRLSKGSISSLLQWLYTTFLNLDHMQWHYREEDIILSLLSLCWNTVWTFIAFWTVCWVLTTGISKC